MLKAAHAGELKTDTLILSDVLMVPGLTRNLISERKLDDKGCYIYTQQGTKQAYNINGKFCFQGIKRLTK